MIFSDPLGLPESVFHAPLDDDCKRTTLSLSGRRIGDRRAAFLGLPHSLLNVTDLEVSPNDRLLMSGQGLPDSHESSVSSSRNTGLPEIGVWGTKGETMQALVEPNQGIYIVAHDFHIVKLDGHLLIALLWHSAAVRPYRAGLAPARHAARTAAGDPDGSPRLVRRH